MPNAPGARMPNAQIIADVTLGQLEITLRHPANAAHQRHHGAQRAEEAADEDA